MYKKKILIVFGTRPELIKLYPLIIILKKNYNLKLFFTSQHDILIRNLIFRLNLKKNIISNSKIKNTSLVSFLSTGLNSLSNIIVKEKPNLIIAQGDTSSTYLAAICALLNNIKFGHVEAGLRTFNKYNPFPEESFRQMISRISDYNFCPTKTNYLNLLNEGINKSKLYITGNTIIDSLNYFYKNDFSNKIKSNKSSVLITLHRRENFMNFSDILVDNLILLINKYKKINFTLVEHANPLVKKTFLEIKKKKLLNLEYIAPKDYQDFIGYLGTKNIVISDSGGIQEECLSLKIPLIVFRENTERVEGLNYNSVILSPPSKSRLVADFGRILKRIKEASEL